MASTSTNPSLEEIKGYDTEQLVTFLRRNLNLTEDEFAILRGQRVSGFVFLRLTERKLLKSPYNLLGGTASVIAELVERLNQSRFYHKIV